MKAEILLVLVVSGVFLLAGCGNQGGAVTHETPPEGEEEAETIDYVTLMGCIPGISFTYSMTTDIGGRIVESIVSYSTSEYDENTILKEGAIETQGMQTNVKEYIDADTCLCKKMDTTYVLEGQETTMEQDCDTPNIGEGSGEIELPEITCTGEEHVEVPAYSGKALVCNVVSDNGVDVTMKVWKAPAVLIPVKMTVETLGTTSDMELTEYEAA
jgi:hypothetical protein